MPGVAIKLTAAQMALLGWVRRGCPEGEYEGFSHRISANALRSRDLVRISGHGKTWQATITDKGKALLAQPAVEVHKRDAAPPADAALEPGPPKVEKPPRLSPTDRMLAELSEGGGVLRAPAWRKKGDPNYHQLVLAANRFGKVPAGKRLTVNTVRGETEVRLEDAIEGTAVSALPVPVLQRVGRYHPVAARYRDDTPSHIVSRKALSRAVRIIHALATEAERRGYEIANVPGIEHRGYRAANTAKSQQHLKIGIRGHSYSLRISEEGVLSRGAYDAESRYRRSVHSRYLEPRSKSSYDQDATGRLKISVDGYSREGRVSSWADRSSWTLEGKLPDLRRELEIRVAEDDNRAAEAKRAAEERRQRWEAAMEEARQRFYEAHRAEQLTAQLAAWNQARHIREYLTALQARHGNDPAATEWIDWIRKYVDETLDPLATPPSMPALPDAPASAIAPYLRKGFSPYGPSGY